METLGIVHVKDYCKFEVLGKTRDDAIGEAFDKVARVVRTSDIQAGPKVDKLAQEGTPNINLPQTYFDDLDFSFSGLKTAVINLHHKDPNINKADLAASFEKTVSEVIINNTKRAVEELKNRNINCNKIVLAGGVSSNTYIRKEFDELSKEKDLQIYYPEKKLVLAGGVSANSYIRKEFENLQKEENIEVYFPELKLCTDNAAMIAAAGYYEYLNGSRADMSLNAIPNLKLQ